jgi:nitroreductase
MVTTVDTYNLITHRKAARNFAPIPNNPAVIKKVITAISYAPGKNNVFPWKVRILDGTDPEMLKKLFELEATFGFTKPKNSEPFGLSIFACPTLICFMRDPKPYPHMPGYLQPNGRELIADLIRNRDRAFFEDCDADIMVAATFGYIEALDLGLNPNFIRCFQPFIVKDYLNLPLEPVVFLALGKQNPDPKFKDTTRMPHPSDFIV